MTSAHGLYRNARLIQAAITSASALAGIALLVTLAKVWPSVKQAGPYILTIMGIAAIIGGCFRRLPWYLALPLGLTVGFLGAFAVGSYAVSQI